MFQHLFSCLIENHPGSIQPRARFLLRLLSISRGVKRESVSVVHLADLSPHAATSMIPSTPGRTLTALSMPTTPSSKCWLCKLNELLVFFLLTTLVLAGYSRDLSRDLDDSKYEWVDVHGADNTFNALG